MNKVNELKKERDEALNELAAYKQAIRTLATQVWANPDEIIENALREARND